MRTRVALALGILLFLCAYTTFGQQQNPPPVKYQIDSARMVYASPLPGVGRFYVVVFLNDSVGPAKTGDFKGNVVLSYPKSGIVVPAAAITSTEIDPTDNRIIHIDLDYANKAAAPAPGDDELQVELPIVLASNRTVQNLKGRGVVYNEQTLPKLVSDLQQGLKDAVATAKTSDEKNIFAGLNVTIPSGAGSDKEGNAEIHFNRTLLSPEFGGKMLADRVLFGLHLNKGSQAGSDPRHFDLGLTYKKTFLRLNQERTTMVRDVLFANPAGPVTPNQGAAAVNAIRNLQQDFVRAFVLDNALRFEGDVRGTAIGNVSNLLYDAQFSVVTVTRALAGGRNSFWNLRLIPAGTEIGYNLTNEDNKDQEKQSLARIKGGATFSLFYEAPSGSHALSKIEFETRGVARYLFRNESAFDEIAKEAVSIDKGTKYWLESNLKFLLGPKIQNGRAGLRIGFSRGFLPPVYAFTKAFTVGLIFESTDDNTSKELKLIK